MSSDIIEITWTVDDGYVNNGPHRTTVDVEEFEGLNEQAIEDLMCEIIQSDFEQQVTFTITSSALTDIQDRLKEDKT